MPIAFLQKIEVIGFVEAVERLADRVGVQLTYEGGGMGHQRDRGTKTRLLEANKRAAEFYAAQLRTPEAAPAMAFLTARGFDAASAERFGCGYAPAGWDALTKHLLAGGFSFEELEKAGLSRQGNRGPMDRFHRRLLWPIRDRGGEVVGFGARRLYDDDRVEAKYLNTAETPVYRKTHVLFGLDLAKSEIVKRRQVVVVEGYTDVMAMHLAGVPTAVASCGTAFGAEHIGVIRRLIGDDSFDLGEVIYTFDGDAAGQAAALKAFEGEQAFTTQTYVTIAPDGQDPCELAADPGRRGRARPRGPPRADLRVRHPLGAARVRSRLGRGPGGRAAAHGTAGRPDQARGAARRVRPPPRGLGQLGRHRDGRAAGAGDGGRARRAARAPSGGGTAQGRPPPARAAGGPEGGAAGAGHRRAQLRRAARAGVHPSRVGRGAPGGAGGGRGRRRDVRSAVGGGRRGRVHGRRPGRGVGAGRRADGAAAAHALALGVGRGPLRGEHRRRGATRAGGSPGGRAEVAAAAHQPVEEPDAYHQLFGDLVPLEQYKIALRTQAAR
jgi:DNA primase